MNFIQRKLYSWLGSKINAAMTAQFVGKGVVSWSGQNKQSMVNDGYRSNDIVYSCVNLITEKAKVAPWFEYEVVDEKKYKQYKSLIADPSKIDDWKQVEMLHKSALEIVSKPSKISELLKYPNDHESWSALVKSLITYKLITGDSYAYGPTIEIGENKGMPNTLHALPSQDMSIIANIDHVIKTVVGYQLQVNTITTFSDYEILHDKLFNPNWDGIGSELYGMSPLEAGARVLTRSNEGKNYAVATLQNGGPSGIMMVKNADFEQADLASQVDLVKQRWKEYQGSKNAGKIPISALEIDYKQVGLGPIEMAILEAELFDMRAICNLYGVPSQLLNDTAAKTYNTTTEAEKSLTVRGALPALTSLRDSLNHKIYKGWGGKDSKRRVVDFDISAFPELQKNKKELIEWISKAPISIERTLELLGEPVPDWMDEETRRTILMPSNLTELGEMPINLPAGQNPYGE